MDDIRDLWRVPRAWTRGHPLVMDSIWASMLLLVVLASIVLTGQNGRWVDGAWVQIPWYYGALVPAALNVLLVAPLAVRRTHPTASVVAIFVASCLALVATAVLGAEVTPAGVVAIPITVYSVTLYGPRWAYRSAIVAALAGTLCYLIVVIDPVASGSSVRSVAVPVHLFLIAVWAFGLMRRSRRDAMTALRDRAERLEVERDQQARIATAAERTRIAREMHDIVAHSLSVIIAQADGGRYAASSDPEAAVRALGTISETGRDALTDMRRLLGVLRPQDGARPGASGTAGALGVGAAGGAAGGAARGEPGSAGPGIAGPDGARAASDGAAGLATDRATTDVGPERLPQPASQDLTKLVEQIRSSGVRVSLVRLGEERRLPPGVGLAVYRICQESLTNVLKHAGPDPTVTVVLRWGEESLGLEVSDDGRGAAATSDGAGQGLLGMRERATMFGGTLTTGPRPGGGFRVRLELPIPRTAPRETTPREGDR